MSGRKIGIVIAVVFVLVVACIMLIRAKPNAGPTAPATQTSEGIDLHKTVNGPSEITADDNGKALSYPVGAHFTVILDSTLYPENALSCAPPNSGVVRVVATAKAVHPPLYARTFEAVKAGTCTMTDTRFTAAIVVTP